MGLTPERSIGISHPGICEPYDSPECLEMNAFLNCSATVFQCNALDNNDTDTFPFNVSLTTSSVPVEEMTYMCQVLDLPSDKDYHLVASEPLIDNINVMHHALIYGCSDYAKIEPSHLSPYQCFMNTINGCNELIAIWTVGSMGICYHENAGFRIGKTGYKKAVIELHWNNPMKTNTYTDGSGLTIYLMPNLRTYDAGMFAIGQMQLEIPPGKMRHTENSTCSSKCTIQSMTGNINIVGALNHMHYLGSAATSQMVSEDGEVIILSREEVYNYDSPKFVVFDDPLVMEPGYKLQLKCHYRSTLQSETTYYGQGT
ncbi:DBH-like monooxygenase protein 1 [Mercenaria mercenaria]|uniref:DBH-like monooxygenase protein 1 n=1 Tax=Mercenaria mercenaria TaxID=6596 RepID=UPI00234E8CBB|nr:DBH-like monooxygenase protein 1 [Mercenaria mercenaria]